MYFISLEDFVSRVNSRGNGELKVTIVDSKQVIVHHVLDVKLTLMECQQTSLKFKYKLPLGAGLLLKVLQTVLSGIRSKKFTLDTSAKCVWLHLGEFGAYKRELAGKHIVSAHFENDKIALELSE